MENLTEEMLKIELDKRKSMIQDQQQQINELQHKILKLIQLLKEKPLISDYNSVVNSDHTHDGRWQDIDHPIIY